MENNNNNDNTCLCNSSHHHEHGDAIIASTDMRERARDELRSEILKAKLRRVHEPQTTNLQWFVHRQRAIPDLPISAVEKGGMV